MTTYLKRNDGTIIDKSETLSLKELVEKNNKNLSYANLKGANLYGANLSNADLKGSDLKNADLTGADLIGADLKGADLSYADLSSANLYGANLSYADLSNANLIGADLTGADLIGADLKGADLSYAILSGVKLNLFQIQPLYYLKKEKETQYAYKIVTNEYKGPWFPTISYEIGKEYIENDCDSDERNLCGSGLNVATLQWCLNNLTDRLLRVSYNPEDIVAIPIASDGKFRVRKFKVVEEVDLKTVGLDL